MDQDSIGHGAGPWSRPHFSRWGPSSLSQKGGRAPIFGHVYCGQTAAWIKMPLGMEGGLGLHDILLDGDPAPSRLKGHIPQLLANVRCGQTAGGTKMPLGIEVGLGPGDFVFDGDPARPRKKGHIHSHPIFGPYVYCDQTAGWMKTPLSMEVDLGPGHIVLDRVPAPLKRSTATHPLFGPCLLWPWSPVSATAELLLSQVTDYVTLCTMFAFCQRINKWK